VLDPKRLLLLWAATRDLAGDIVYSTRSGILQRRWKLVSHHHNSDRLQGFRQA